jgi:PST family polysaccharide transporter
LRLKKQVLSGVKWIAIANIFRQILSFVSIVIFAKLLSVEDFGIFSILMIFNSFLIIFGDMGTTAVIVHQQKPSKLLLSSLFYFNLFTGFTLSSLLILSSHSISTFFEIPKLEPLLKLISLNFIIISFMLVQKALLEKNMNFKSISTAESLSVLIGLILGLISAYYGMGVYSLITQTLSTSIIATVMLWFYSRWKPEWRFSLDEIKKIWKYTANLSAFEIINHFSTQADSFLIGKYLSASALGIYSIAYKIMLYPLQNISRVLMRVLFPAFSKLQNNDEKFREVYKHAIFYISLIAFPIMTGLMSTADVLVDLLFGDKWEGLALLLMILAPSGMIRSIFTTTGAIYKAKGNTDLQLKMGILFTVLTIIGFIIGLSYGVNGVATSYLITNILISYPVFKISWGQIGLSVKEGLRTIIPILLISLLMGAAIHLLDFLLFHQIKVLSIRLTLMVTSGIAIYAALINFQYGNIKALFSKLKN